ncbi:uncharacterized protein BDZ99DRAFT_258058 [Mytilinidion resinicola]|uniref:Mitochondrial ATPase inhibitor n=1 Tax=Mytilinidion resinicola TaxID=574789 RepID=A0A6A6YXJ4_9PEZI|nr:uncharacterized protein BDZ99DRAFT_258058 [Mytilinidion resinicola]KAF2813510.1 hypothetical protein BDZ99DRAFT_258058 [Mytilinidion resinicola]
MASLRAFTRRTPLLANSYIQHAGFAVSARVGAGKESALGHEGRADEIDEHKADALKKQKEGKGEWKDALATDSESIIKADRGELEASEQTIKKLQEETKKVEGKK